MQPRAIDVLPPNYIPALIQNLRGSTIAIGGATGFVGTALVQFLNELADSTGETFRLITLSRATPLEVKSRAIDHYHFIGDRAAFLDACLRLNVSHYFHFATPTTAARGSGDFAATRDSTISLLEQMITLGKTLGRLRILNASSGAVYGSKSLSTPLRLGSPFSTQSLDDSTLENYIQIKRESESLLTSAAGKEITGTNARLFAFMGPGLPLNAHYAIGNFIADAVCSRSILVRQPLTMRGYLPREQMAAQIAISLLVLNDPLIHIASASVHTLQFYAEIIGRVSRLPVELRDEGVASYYAGEAWPFGDWPIKGGLDSYLERWYLHEKIRSG